MATKVNQYMRIRRAVMVAGLPTKSRKFPQSNSAKITTSLTCSKGSAFISISVMAQSARRTRSQRDASGSFRKRRRARRN